VTKWTGFERNIKEMFKERFVGKIYERYIYNAVSAHPFVPFTRVRKQAHVMQLIRHMDDTGRRSRSVLTRARKLLAFLSSEFVVIPRVPHECVY